MLLEATGRRCAAPVTKIVHDFYEEYAKEFNHIFIYLATTSR
jgi:hypothetical protein